MTRRTVAAAIALIVLGAGARAQEWRTSSIAAFDEVWQTVNDTFHDPAFGGLDWASVRQELRPRALAAASPDAVRAVIRDMLGRLQRSHFALLSAAATEDTLPGPVRVPIDVRVLDAGVVITRVTDDEAGRVGLRPGQIVVEVDGKTIAQLAGPLEGLSPRARRLETCRRVIRALHGVPGSEASLRVRDIDGRVRTITAARQAGGGQVVTLGNLPPLEVQFSAEEARTPRGRRAGIIAFSIWMAPVGDRFAASLDRHRAADGIVIDLRGNPGGLALMMNGVAGHFFPEPATLGVMQTRMAPQLQFKANPQLSTPEGKRVDPFGGPVAILVDDLTGSASETFAAGMQSLGRARIFGRQTMGQALPASTRRLSNGDVLMYAVGDFVTSTGHRVEGAGVIPDEIITLTPEALATGRDPVLDAALAWIDRTPLPPARLVAMLQAPARPALPSALLGRTRP